MLPRALLALFLTFLLAAPAAAQTAPGKRVALVIGNERYERYETFSRLNNPVRDARAIARILKEAGFELVGACPELACPDVKGEGFRRLLRELQRAAENAELALFFYAGHGMQVDISRHNDGRRTFRKANILAPVDAKLEGPGHPRDVYPDIEVQAIVEAVSPARNKIVLIDACRNELSEPTPTFRGSLPHPSFGPMADLSDASGIKTSIYLMPSTGAGRTASDGPKGGHSPFAKAVIHHFTENAGMELHKVLELINLQVIKDTKSQSPDKFSKGPPITLCLKQEKCGELPGQFGQHTEDERHWGEALWRKLRRKINQSVGIIALILICGFTVVVVYLHLTRSPQRKSPEIELDPTDNDMRGSVVDTVRRSTQVSIAAASTNGSGPAPPIIDRIEAAQAKMRAGASSNILEEFRAIASAQEAHLSQERRIAVLARLRQGAAELSFNELACAKGAYEAAHQHDPSDPEPLERLGDVAVLEPLLDDALKHYNDALSMWKRQADEAPSDPIGKMNIGMCLNKIGGVYARLEKLPIARTYFLQALDIRKHLSDAHLDNTEWRRDLSVSYAKLGDVDLAEGHFKAALINYEADLAIAVDLAKQDNSSENIVDLIVSLIKVADALKMGKEFHEALAKLREAFGAIDQLLKPHSGEERLLRLLSVYHERVGDLLVETRRREEALDAYKKSLGLREDLATSERVSGNALFDLAVAYWKLASNGEDARSNWERALELLRRLEADNQLTPAKKKWLSVAEASLAALK